MLQAILILASIATIFISGFVAVVVFYHDPWALLIWVLVALVVRAIHRHAAERRAERAPRHSPTLEQLAAEHAARDQLLADAIASVRARPIPNRYSRGVVRREPDPPPYIIVPHDFTEDRPWSPPPWLS